MSLKNTLKRFFELEDDYEYLETEFEQEEPETKKVPKTSKQQNVVSLQSVQKSARVVLVEPRAYSEVQEIADQLKNRRAVIINLQRVSRDQGKRIIDFLSGTVYAIGGDIQKLGDQTFLCTPDNVDVTGAISEANLDEELTDMRW